MPDIDWLKLAKESYLSSTSYLDNNFRKKIEDNIRHFQSKHHAASKYNKPAYKLRSRIFRPKTRAYVRSNEAAAVAAFFANKDAASIEAQNPDDAIQVASADVTKELLKFTSIIHYCILKINSKAERQCDSKLCKEKRVDKIRKRDTLLEKIEVQLLTANRRASQSW